MGALVSFYSYKGGVGRTFVALETAVELARRGRRVCFWDLDLDAPGCQLQPALWPAARDLRLGTIDLWERHGRTASIQGVPASEVLDSLVRLPLDDEGGGPFFLFPARLDEAVPPYAERYQAIDWAVEFAAGHALAFLTSVAETLTQAFDLVVMDSRTGFSDIGGATAALLPDATVVVFGPSVQNLQGAKRVLAALGNARPSDPIARLRVLTMVPGQSQVDPETLTRLRRNVAEAGLRPDVEIPLIPAWLADETVPSLRTERFDSTELSSIVAWVDSRIEEEALGAAYASTDPGEGGHGDERGFVDRVAELYELAGWRVSTDVRLGSLQFDLRLERSDQGLRRTVLVECKTGRRPAEAAAVVEFASRVEAAGRETRDRFDAVMVSRGGFSGAAPDVAFDRGVELQTLSDIERLLVDAAPAVAAVRERVARSPVADLWIEPWVLIDGVLAHHAPCREFIRSWLDDRESRVLLVMGRPGMGKSSLLLRTAEDLAREHEGDPDAPWPLMLVVRDLERGAISADSMLASALDRARMPSSSLPALGHLISTGRVLLCVDGFDEGSVDEATLEAAMFALVECLGTDGKAIVSCRDLAERPTAGRGPDSGGAFGSALDGARAVVARLQPFTPEQVRSYLEQRFGNREASQIARWLQQAPELAEMASVPSLSQLIGEVAQALPDGDTSHNLADLLDRYLELWLLDASAPATTSEMLGRILEQMAVAVWEGAAAVGRDWVHLAIVRLSPDRPLSDSDIDDLQIRLAACPFLSSSRTGAFRFVHQSLVEFLVSRAVHRALREEDANGLDFKTISKDVVGLLDGRLGDAELTFLRSLFSQPYRRQVVENAIAVAVGLRESAFLVGTSFETPEARTVDPDRGYLLAALDQLIAEGASLGTIEPDAGGLPTWNSLLDAWLVRCEEWLADNISAPSAARFREVTSPPEPSIFTHDHLARLMVVLSLGVQMLQEERTWLSGRRAEVFGGAAGAHSVAQRPDVFGEHRAACRATALHGLEQVGLKGWFEATASLSTSGDWSQRELLDAVEHAQVRTFGWPIGLVLESAEGRPRPLVDGVVAEVSVPANSHLLLDRPSYDYWNVYRSGEFYTLRSLFEDSRGAEDSLYFNTRIVQAAEFVMFVHRLFRRLGASDHGRVHLGLTHGGLQGRRLTAVGNRTLSVEGRTAEDRVSSEVSANLRDLDVNLVGHVSSLVHPLFMLFDFTEVADEVLSDIVTRFATGEVS